MLRNDTIIGSVESVLGNRISILIDTDRLPSNVPVIDGRVYRVGQIGSFLRVPVGYIDLYGVVTQAGADAIPEKLRDTDDPDKLKKQARNWLTMVLVGERIGDHFERGVSQSPVAGDQVHLVTIDDLKIIYGNMDDKTSISIGQISASESLSARLDIDKLVTRHVALLGSTGSGKSNAVTVFLCEIAKGKFPSARILLIDPHGEYGTALGRYARVFKINADVQNGEYPLFIPYWALPFGELLKTFVGVLTDPQEEYVREKIFSKKLEASKLLSSPPEEAALSADSPIPFSLKELWYQLDRFERLTINRGANGVITEALIKEGDSDSLVSAQFEPHSTTNTNPYLNNQAKGILRYLNNIRNRLVDQRFNFFFHSGEWEPAKDGKIKKDLDALLIDWLAHDRPITVLDLSGVPPEITAIVSGAVIRIAYDALFWAQDLPIGGRKQPLLMVLEEAHMYLQAGEESVASTSVRSIAKEGRKYGLGLMLVTQRPSELDPTVLSQCGTTIALRMTNGQDRGHVSSAVQDDLSDMLALIPSLRTGEALIFGEAVKIPSRVRIDAATKAPRSEDPKVSMAWAQTPPSADYYKQAIDLWRNGRFSIEKKEK
ncbi:MAG: ATP-binding protein [Candidatus Omnitrophica bacterium]|nr:ATP-binding protein [Candidatus Omnitrophota bacterium]MDD5351719.1 ATP-binding protein [Candidatus Omnitrophota bacterium]MDD5550929.1 ATP-binding protein [Candidatus Omnitrophota bacterium]